MRERCVSVACEQSKHQALFCGCRHKSSRTTRAQLVAQLVQHITHVIRRRSRQRSQTSPHFSAHSPEAKYHVTCANRNMQQSNVGCKAERARRSLLLVRLLVQRRVTRACGDDDCGPSPCTPSPHTPTPHTLLHALTVAPRSPTHVGARANCGNSALCICIPVCIDRRCGRYVRTNERV